jgi:hypothetical protein
VPRLDTHNIQLRSAQVLEEKLLQLGDDVKEGFCSIPWYFLVNWCANLPIEGVEEDIMFGLWYIYIEEVFVGFSPP